MIALPFALSLSNTVTDVGAIAAFAALFGIAILSLLVFSQAREIKRLREWAGRAPERAVEMEQRVSADAAARVQRTATPAARVVPRKTPLVSAPVSTAVNATAAATAVAGPPAPPPSTQADQPASVPSTAAAQANQPGSVPATPAVQADRPASADPAGVPSSPPATDAQSPSANSAAAQEPASAPANDASTGEQAEIKTGTGEQSPVEQVAAAPATAAARAGGVVAARAALPPSPAKPSPPGASSQPSTQAGSTGAGAAEPPSPAPRQAASVAAAQRMPSRAVGADAPPRSPSPPRARPAGSAATPAARAISARGPVAGGPKYYKPERSPARPFALIVGGVVLVALLVVLAVSVFKGGGGKAHTATQSLAPVETQAVKSQSTSTSSHAVASNPAETAVAVLNGTGTSGLAHHLAADLQQGGYTRAVALAGVPPGTHASTVVQYAHGHRADAQAVAKSLNVTQVQAMETTIASLAGSATVVVLAGADQASLLGGGGAQSNGEPAATAGSGQ
jgi:hypothetical protein